MANKESLRSRVVSLVISALDQISDDFPIDVRLDGARLIVTADLSVARSSRTKAATPARARAVPATQRAALNKSKNGGTKKTGKAATEPHDPDLGEKILAVLLLEDNVNGLNQADLRKALRMKVVSKKRIKLAANQLVEQEKLLKVAGGRYRHSNAVVKRGRKRKARPGNGPGTTAPKKRGPGRPPKNRAAPPAKKDEKKPRSKTGARRPKGAKSKTKPAKATKGAKQAAKRKSAEDAASASPKKRTTNPLKIVKNDASAKNPAKPEAIDTVPERDEQAPRELAREKVVEDQPTDE